MKKRITINFRIRYNSNTDFALRYLHFWVRRNQLFAIYAFCVHAYKYNRSTEF